ncbi:PREDICTED: rve domain-containing, partial [Prunus dulcis]
HPQANNQVEAVNKLLKRTLKKELEAKKGAWSKLLPEVLWAYRCTERTSTRETPYSLAFGVEAIIPVEVGVPTHRVNRYTPKVNVEQFSLSMVLLEEHRLCAALHLATYQP